MLVFIYYWLIERTKYFSASFFFFVPKHRKNVAKPQKNLSSDPKIIIILSFKNLTKNPKRTTNTSQAPLQLPAFSRLHALQHHFRHPSCPPPSAHSSCPWVPILLSPPPSHVQAQQNTFCCTTRTTSALAISSFFWQLKLYFELENWQQNRHALTGTYQLSRHKLGMEAPWSSIVFNKHYFCKWKTAALVGLLSMCLAPSPFFSLAST